MKTQHPDRCFARSLIVGTLALTAAILLWGWLARANGADATLTPYTAAPLPVSEPAKALPLSTGTTAVTGSGSLVCAGSVCLVTTGTDANPIQAARIALDKALDAWQTTAGSLADATTIRDKAQAVVDALTISASTADAAVTDAQAAYDAIRHPKPKPVPPIPDPPTPPPAPAADLAIVMVSSPNCPACDAMGPTLTALKAAGVKITRDDNFAKYNVTQTPTFVLLRSGTEAQRTAAGALSQDSLAKWYAAWQDYIKK